MPSYDYNCKKCGENFTVEKSMSDSSTPECPKCNSNNDVVKVWGGFQLKGCCSEGSSMPSSGGCSSCGGGSCSTCH